MENRADHDLAFMMQYENVAWYENGKVRILDRRIYPLEVRYITCTEYAQVAQAIADMVTQSEGPYVAAAMGMALAAYQAQKGKEEIIPYLKKAGAALSQARPTTARRMKKIVDGSLAVAEQYLAAKGSAGLDQALFNYALQFLENNYKNFTKVGKTMASLFPQNGTILTQCFAGTIIATMLRECRQNGNPIHLYCAETRPFLQGARLTASVACDMGFDVTVITDNMPAYVMQNKHVDIFTSAADVITMDGHIVNKVGTLQIALAAHYCGVPYYATGRPDPAHLHKESICIEERDPAQVLEFMGIKTTMKGVKGYYPAFDITPPELCNGIVTDKGIFTPRDCGRYYSEEAKEEKSC